MSEDEDIGDLEDDEKDFDVEGQDDEAVEIGVEEQRRQKTGKCQCKGKGN